MAVQMLLLLLRIFFLPLLSLMVTAMYYFAVYDQICLHLKLKMTLNTHLAILRNFFSPPQCHS